MTSIIERSEQLKSELTDKWVVVSADIPELRRFAKLTGKVKTVNMNGRALVQFDGPEDISWYDIDPSYLTVVDAPREKEKPAAAPKKAAAAPAKSSGAAPAAGGKKLSPLELARQQGSGGAKAAQPAPAAGKKLSPLELARQQGAGAKAATPAKPAAEKPAAEKPAAAGGKKLSPLELARQQGAGGAAPAPAKQDEAPQPAAAATEEAATPAAEAAPASTAGAGGGTVPTPSSTAEIIALCRQQGPFKG